VTIEPKKKTLRSSLRQIPVLGPLALSLLVRLRNIRFGGSRSYWDERYKEGGLSGSGSYGRLAEFKAEFLNSFVASHDIKTVIELGCGDGNQLSLAQYSRYVGVDVSPEAIRLCREKFGDDPTKSFFLVTEQEQYSEACDLALSLDVLYHLVEDSVFEEYMKGLFLRSQKYTIIFSSNKDEQTNSLHVRHRKFMIWVETNAPDWKLVQEVKNRYPFDMQNPSETSFADFYVFEHQADSRPAG
jgi:SAM-dependent methyltransferase